MSNKLMKKASHWAAYGSGSSGRACDESFELLNSSLLQGEATVNMDWQIDADSWKPLKTAQNAKWFPWFLIFSLRNEYWYKAET